MAGPGRARYDGDGQTELTMPNDRAIEGYHAHIYYDAATKPIAAQLREAIGATFSVRLGRWHDKPVGPHPVSMYQVAFAVEEFSRLAPWLMLNRQGLNVLVHPETGNDYVDHTDFAVWLGAPIALKLDVLHRGERARSLSGRVIRTASA
jgi:DOPA 4,5-dioxygenase